MIHRLSAKIADIFAHWRIGLMAAVVVAFLLTLGLSMRPRYIAEATVYIGGTLSEGPVGIDRFLPFEEAREIEHFFSHEAFGKVSSGIDDRCIAGVMHSPNGLRLKMTCRGENERQVRELNLSTLGPLLERHARYYELKKTAIEQHQKGIECQSEVLIIEPLAKIENRHNQIKELGKSRVIQTQFDTQGVTVLDRKPSFWIWTVVAVLALFAGLFAVVFASTLKHLEQEAPRRNA